MTIYNQSYTSPFNNEKISHTSNYSGIFQTGEDYKKFDFVYNTGDGLFYYATEDMSFGGGAILSGTNRFILDPDGPIINGRQSHYIYDDLTQAGDLGEELKAGQTVNLAGSIQDASGLYNIINVESGVLRFRYEVAENSEARGIHVNSDIKFLTENGPYNTDNGEPFFDLYRSYEVDNIIASQTEYDALPAQGYFEPGRRRGRIYVLGKNDLSFVDILDFSEQENDGELTRIHLQGISEEIAIDQYEDAGSHNVVISAINEDPTSSNKWVRDRFFFDADYGSSASFKAFNKKIEFENGYYKLFPKSVNSLNCEFNLTFKNRDNRESNAITHFLENHLGQLEKDKQSSALAYSQGISGFRWDGNATFHPYDSIDNQTRKFYCLNFDHSLNFENSNDLSVTLKNFDASWLNKSESLFTKKAEDYDNKKLYFENDIVFSDVNMQYYYCYNDGGVGFSSKDPVVENANWTRESGRYSDINTNYWSREFFWKPSIGLTVSQKPRLKEISSSFTNYTQIYNDGINESLLNLNLSFKNRSDKEAYAILHFLEQHLGCTPFLFSPPAPYETPQNFVCQQWDHTYNFKNNHTISAVFEQYPFNFSATKLDNKDTEPLAGQGELIFKSPLIFSSKNTDRLDQSRNFKARLFIENIGGEPVDINSIQIFSNNVVKFDILGQGNDVNNVPIAVPSRLSREDYICNFPPDIYIHGLTNKEIKLDKKWTEGAEGGQFFSTVQPGTHTSIERFFQKNDGRIKNISTNSEYLECNYFVIEDFLKNIEGRQGLNAGEKGYIDIIYNKDTLDLKDFLVDKDGNQISYRSGTSSGNILLGQSSGFLSAEFELQSTDQFSPHRGELKVYIYNE